MITSWDILRDDFKLNILGFPWMARESIHTHPNKSMIFLAHIPIWPRSAASRCARWALWPPFLWSATGTRVSAACWMWPGVDRVDRVDQKVGIYHWPPPKRHEKWVRMADLTMKHWSIWFKHQKLGIWSPTFWALKQKLWRNWFGFVSKTCDSPILGHEIMGKGWSGWFANGVFSTNKVMGSQKQPFHLDTLGFLAYFIRYRVQWGFGHDMEFNHRFFSWIGGFQHQSMATVI